MSRSNTLHHIGTAVGLIGLGVWFLVAEKLSIFKVITELFPESHAGAGLMLAIMLVMAPGFFVWKFFNRWLEKRLDIKGIYYEDSYYNQTKNLSKKDENSE